MRHNKIIIVSVFLLALCGAFSIITNSHLTLTIYTSLLTALLVLVGVGGIIDYNRVEIRDIREIYQEKIKLMKEKQEELNEIIIENEKELIKLRGKICQESAIANRKSSDNTWITKCIS